MGSRFFFAGAGLGAVISCLACGNVTDETYRGEAMATIQARLVQHNDTPVPDDLRVLIVWQRIAGEYDPGTIGSIWEVYVGESVEVTGEFPNRFSLVLHEPPPDNAIDPSRGGDDPAVAVGTLWVVRGEADEDPGKWTEEDTYGCPFYTYIHYFDRDTGQISEGYHQWARTPESKRAWDDFQACKDRRWEREAQCEIECREYNMMPDGDASCSDNCLGICETPTIPRLHWLPIETEIVVPIGECDVATPVGYDGVNGAEDRT